MTERGGRTFAHEVPFQLRDGRQHGDEDLADRPASVDLLIDQNESHWDATTSYLRSLEEENQDLRGRLEKGRQGVERLLARIRFLEGQR